jgi:hypothetical protein
MPFDAAQNPAKGKVLIAESLQQDCTENENAPARMNASRGVAQEIPDYFTPRGLQIALDGMPGPPRIRAGYLSALGRLKK